MEKQTIKNKELNYARIGLSTECSADEFSIEILDFIGSLNINLLGGVDDISLIKDCITNSLDELKLQRDCFYQIILVESGEWEDVSWHKYYEIIKILKYEID